MSECPIQIEELIIKYAQGQRLSKKELVQLREWQGRSENHQVLPDKFQDPNWLRENLRRLENVPSDRMWDEIQDRIAVAVQNEPRRSPGHLRRALQWASYAAVVSGITLGWLVLKHLTATDSNRLEYSDNVAGAPITGVFRQNESLEVTLGTLDRAESGLAVLKWKGDTIEVPAMASR